MIHRGIEHDDSVMSQQKPDESSPSITRFFKIMFGNSFSEVLYLPPEFAQTVDHLAGQETQIEDSRGKKWSVSLSYVNGSLAFGKGWHKFYIDHDLEEGHFLVFSYIKGSHFSVQIYGASACERTHFSYGMPQLNKRSRGNLVIVSEDEPFQANDVSARRSRRDIKRVSGEEPFQANFVSARRSRRRNLKIVFEDEPFQANNVTARDKQGSGSKLWNHQTHLEGVNVNIGRTQLHSISTNMDDPICMITRDDGCKGENRNFWSGLSIFEMETETQGSNRVEKALDTEMGLIQSEITGNTTRCRNAAFAHIGIAEQTKTKGDGMPAPNADRVCEYSGKRSTDNSAQTLYTTVATSSSDDIEHFEKRRHDAKKDAVQNSDTDGVEHLKTRMHDAKKDAVHTSDTDGMEQPKTRRYYGRKSVVHTSESDSMEQPKTRRYYGRKSVIHTSESDSMEQPKTSRHYVKKGVVFTSHSDSMGKHETRRHDGRKVVTYGSDTDSMEQPKTRRHNARKGVVYTVHGSSCVKFKNISESKLALHTESRGQSKGKRDGVPNIQHDAGRELTTGSRHGLSDNTDSSDATAPSDAISPFSAEVKSRTSLEFLVNMPSVRGRGANWPEKIIFLKDGRGKLWPVICTTEYHSKALTRNWESFCKGNHIIPGDECRFHADKGMLHTYRVEITHKMH